MSAPFMHTPRAPQVPKEARHAAQRRFGGGLGMDATGKSVYKFQDSSAEVYRDAEADCAELRLRTRNQHSQSETAVFLTADECEEMARRLLDAAHDLKAFPASVLVRGLVDVAPAAGTEGCAS